MFSSLFGKKTLPEKVPQTLKDFKRQFSTISEGERLIDKTQYVGFYDYKFVEKLVKFYFDNELSTEDKDEIDEYFIKLPNRQFRAPNYYDNQDEIRFTEKFSTEEDFYKNSHIESIKNDEKRINAGFSAVSAEARKPGKGYEYMLPAGGKKKKLTKRRRHAKRRRHTKRR